LSGREAAITSAAAGTTRDVIEAPTAIGGTPFLLVDTAGLRDSEDVVEAIGVGRARESLAAADLILWLGRPAECPVPERALFVQSKVDIEERDPGAQLHVSARTGEGIDALVAAITERAAMLLPKEGDVALNRRQRSALAEAAAALRDTRLQSDILLAAEGLRAARSALDGVTGGSGVEDMLDALFARFCIGK
jgi:tRNA modification GTPase